MTTPEAAARQKIDAQLSAAGWAVATPGSAIGAQPTALCESAGHSGTQSGRADYVLYLDGKACGILEAKRSDHSLEGVQEQSATYAAFRRWEDPTTCWQNPLPFRFEANGRQWSGATWTTRQGCPEGERGGVHQIQFTDARDPEPRARPIFHFPKPESLKELLGTHQWHDRPGHDPQALNTTTLRTRLAALTDVEKSNASLTGTLPADDFSRLGLDGSKPFPKPGEILPNENPATLAA